MGNVTSTHHEAPPRKRIHERERAVHRTQKRWVHRAKLEYQEVRKVYRYALCPFGE